MHTFKTINITLHYYKPEHFSKVIMNVQLFIDGVEYECEDLELNCISTYRNLRFYTDRGLVRVTIDEDDEYSIITPDTRFFRRTFTDFDFVEWNKSPNDYTEAEKAAMAEIETW